jgi:DNA (cytosine-5)-methyltransferase 1
MTQKDAGKLSLTDLAARIARHHRAAEAARVSAMEDYRATGRYLLAVKEQLPHGEYRRWVEAHLEEFGMKDYRRARECTQLAELSDDEWRHVATFSSPGYALKMLGKARPTKAPEQPDCAPAAFPVVVGVPLMSLTDRPPFRRPTMAAVEQAARADGLGVISTFSGAGGSSLGWKLAGCRVLAAVEFRSLAAETYQANFPGVPVIERDVREVTGADLLDAAGLRAGELDVLDGSPPCAAFSPAGRGPKPGKKRRYSGTSQRVDDLLLEFARLAREASPRVVVAENVPALAESKGRPYFDAFLAALRDAGYEVQASVLDAQWLGVPQARRRLIILGIRRDLVDHEAGITPAACFPVPLPYSYSLGDALHSLSDPDAAEEADRAAASIERFAIGEVWKSLTPGGKSPRYPSLVRPHPEAPCPTVTATAGSSVAAAGVTHPDEPRKLTPAELRAVFGFPADFRLVGTFEQRAERMGRAVPPPLMAAVSKRVATTLARNGRAAARRAERTSAAPVSTKPSADDQIALGRRMRDAIRRELAGMSGPPAVLLSGGMDSLAVAAVARDLYDGVRAYTFCLEDRESADLAGARRAAEHLGIPLSVVWLSTDLERLEADVGALISDGVRGKAAIECSWPVRRAIEKAADDGYEAVATGAAADGHFALSKRAMIHFREPLEKLDEFRAAYFGDPDKAQVSSTREWARAELDVDVRAPFHSERMCAVTRGVPWDALNKPRQKEPLRLAFEAETPEKPPARHTNLQLGDSGISALFGRLVGSDNSSTRRAAYRRIAEAVAA